MVIQTYTDSVRLGQRDLDIMSFVSTQVAIAIEHVRAEQVTIQRTKELKALYDTSLDIISTHELPILLETIVERAARLLNASMPAGCIYAMQSVEKSAAWSVITPSKITVARCSSMAKAPPGR